MANEGSPMERGLPLWHRNAGSSVLRASGGAGNTLSVRTVSRTVRTESVSSAANLLFVPRGMSRAIGRFCCQKSLDEMTCVLTKACEEPCESLRRLRPRGADASARAHILSRCWLDTAEPRTLSRLCGRLALSTRLAEGHARPPLRSVGCASDIALRL
ncbi:hypothetical protein AAFF_G00222690 [Aldrovandia affinis]|uniref:Uncharacterized protein n=1 Tax=Aldrovandia affinis TaxID=143900 RepID=A0AAD7RIA5_9TELE|nr:hypothetical protein AAFF_G00222690 [Aldrovandia affinis]